MRKILEGLFDMLLNIYIVLSSKYTGKYIDRVISDERSLIRYWFYTSIADEERYDNPPEGDIIFLISSWMNDIFSIEKDTTGLVERFNGDKEKFIDYLCSSVEESQENIKRGWEELRRWISEGGDVPERFKEETNLKSDLKTEGKVSEIST